VEAPLIPVCNEPVLKRGGLLSRIFSTGLFSGTKGPLEPVLKPFFLPVSRFNCTIFFEMGRISLIKMMHTAFLYFIYSTRVGKKAL
jgi:hypothetical protein